MFADPIGPPFPQVHLSVFFLFVCFVLFFLGGGGGEGATGFQFKQTQAVEFPQVQASTYNPCYKCIPSNS